MTRDNPAWGGKNVDTRQRGAPNDRRCCVRDCLRYARSTVEADLAGELISVRVCARHVEPRNVRLCDDEYGLVIEGEFEEQGEADKHLVCTTPQQFVDDCADIIAIARMLMAGYQSSYVLAHERGRHGSEGKSGGHGSAVEADWMAAKPVRDQLAEVARHVTAAKNSIAAARAAHAKIRTLVDRTIPQRIEPADHRRERVATTLDLAEANEAKAKDLRHEADRLERVAAKHRADHAKNLAAELKAEKARQLAKQRGSRAAKGWVRA